MGWWQVKHKSISIPSDSFNIFSQHSALCTKLSEVTVSKADILLFPYQTTHYYKDSWEQKVVYPPLTCQKWYPGTLTEIVQQYLHFNSAVKLTEKQRSQCVCNSVCILMASKPCSINWSSQKILFKCIKK